MSMLDPHGLAASLNAGIEASMAVKDACAWLTDLSEILQYPVCYL